jgi:16S rRNA (guanine966-N2)-methyltransferase
MRIVGGSLGGRRIPVPKKGVRPTSERVREALMSMLGPTIVGQRVLDCFAGSGAFGIEAISRGASHCTFVEAEAAHVRALSQTVEALGIRDRVSIVRGDAVAVLGRLERKTDGFDILFFDPPYQHTELLERTLAAGCALAAPGARFIAEHGPRDRLPDTISPPECRTEDLSVVERRAWGSTGVAIYALTTKSEAPIGPLEG